MSTYSGVKGSRSLAYLLEAAQIYKNYLAFAKLTLSYV